MTSKTIKKIRNALKRRLRLVINTRHNKLYFSSVIDYHVYICRSMELTPILQELIEEDKIAPIYLNDIFNDFLMSDFLKREVPKVHSYPNFYNTQIEEKYGLMKDFVRLTQNDYSDYVKHPNRIYFNPNIPIIRTERDEDFYYTQKLHNDIIEKLDELEDGLPQKTIRFDSETSILHFNGKSILISKKAENDPHELLKTIFKDKTKTWNTDEILDDWKFDLANNTPKNKIYQAGKATNRVIAQETAIKDFLVVTTKTVAINKKYLNE